jgi:regulatory protein YycH of two-component signal transduction system YycFG
MDVNELVEQYIKLRDKKAEIKREYELKVEKLDAVLDKIEVTLLKTFQDSGLDSVSTKAGTAYTSTRSSAKVADKDAFMEFVIEGKNWEFLENRCSKEAVEQFKAAHNDLPPGISWTEIRTVNVRRKS